ncbi:hypothetical protein ACHAXN_001504, partial [Cyclotella atomus]
MNVINVINRAQRFMLGHIPLQASASAPTSLNRSIPSNASGISTSTRNGGPVSILRSRLTRDLDAAAAAANSNASGLPTSTPKLSVYNGGPVSVLRHLTRNMDDHDAAAAAVANHRARFDGHVRVQLSPPDWIYPKTPICTVCDEKYDSKTMKPSCGCDRFNLNEIQGCRVVHVTEPKSSSYRSAPVCFDPSVTVKEIDLVGYCRECDKGHHSCKCWTAQYSFGLGENEFLASYVDSKSSISSDAPPQPILTRVLNYFVGPNDTSEESVDSDAVKVIRAANKRLAEKTKWPTRSVFDELSQSNVAAPEVGRFTIVAWLIVAYSGVTISIHLMYHSSQIVSFKLSSIELSSVEQETPLPVQPIETKPVPEQTPLKVSTSSAISPNRSIPSNASGVPTSICDGGPVTSDLDAAAAAFGDHGVAAPEIVQFGEPVMLCSYDRKCK